MIQLYKSFCFTAFILLSGFGFYTAPASAQSYYIKTKNVADLYKFFRWHPSQAPLISAHRGGPVAAFPENCIATFEHSLSISPSLIECDIMMSKDSVAVMMHDKTLERTSNGTGEIIAHTWASLDTLKLKDNEGKLTDYEIPTLEEVLIWAKGKAVLTLDVKRNFPAAELVSLIRKHKAAAYVVIITYSLEDALVYYRLAPDLILSISAQNPEELQAFLDAGMKPRQLLAFVGVDNFDATMAAFAHSRKVNCILGTMYKTDAHAEEIGYKAYLPLIEQKKIDIFATDQPLMMKQAIQEVFKTSKNKRKKFISFE